MEDTILYKLAVAHIRRNLITNPRVGSFGFDEWDLAWDFQEFSGLLPAGAECLSGGRACTWLLELVQHLAKELNIRLRS